MFNARTIRDSALATAFAITALVATVAAEEVNLNCWESTAIPGVSPPVSFPPQDGTTSWATRKIEQTATTTTNEALGFLFTNATTQEVNCSWVVPYSYDDAAGSPPSITVMGWTISDQSCTLDGGTTKYVELEISSRAYGAGDHVNAAWSSVDTAAVAIPCTNNGCGAGIHCNLGEYLRMAEGDATPSAGDWTPGGLALIRIKRDTSDTSTQDFILTGVKLAYTPQ